MEGIENTAEEFIGGLVDLSLKLLISILIMTVSFRLITLISRRVEKKLLSGKHSLDKTLTTTLIYTGRIALKLIIILGLIGYLGVDTSGIAALLASLGVGVGLAVNGALSNLAGGVLLIVTRPFKIDDYIEADGSSGTVEDIHITMTRIRTPDNKTVYIPNGKLSSEKIINYSEKGTRRLDLLFFTDPSSDGELVKGLIIGVLSAHPLLLKEPTSFVSISERGSDGIGFTVRAWCKSEDYLSVYFDISEQVNSALASNNISVPHRKIDINVNKI